jgi:hypothetical protein
VSNCCANTYRLDSAGKVLPVWPFRIMRENVREDQQQ